MTYGELRAAFKALLNRDDLTDATCDVLIGGAMRDVQSVVRLPSQEDVNFTIVVVPTSNLLLPDDYLETLAVLVGNQAINRVGSYAMLRRGPQPSFPTTYARHGNYLYLDAPVPTGHTIEHLYYRAFSPISSDTDSNELTDGAPDAVLYGALARAGDQFEHDKRMEWAERFSVQLTALQERIRSEDWSGEIESVRSPYGI